MSTVSGGNRIDEHAPQLPATPRPGERCEFGRKAGKRRFSERTIWLCGLAVACSGAGQDIETPTAPGDEDAPDITGSYDATLEDAVGCDAAPPPDFVTGTLDLSGPPSALVFAFEDGSELAGAVDDTFTVTVEGEVTAGEFALSVTGEGLAYIDADLWVLEVDLTMDATSSGGACARRGLMRAVQTGVAK
jgi:hypothetical protein